MTAAELVRQFLVDAPGDALCNARCARSRRPSPPSQPSSAQRRARVAAATIAAVVFKVPIPKCAHCGGPLNEGEDGVIIDGDRFHDVCMRRLITDETIRVSRRLSRQSRELIEQSRRRLRNPESDATT